MEKYIKRERDIMEFVEPIREQKQIKDMIKHLKAYDTSLRNYTLFVLGINSGLRISDLLALKVEDVKGKDRIFIREEKTGKAKDFPLSNICVKAIKEYLTLNKMTTGYLFPSRKGDKAITRVQAYRILNDAAGHAKIPGQVGTHTLRKTFAYHAYKAGVDITRIQKLLNHSAPSVTLAYIGITKEELDKVYIDLNLGG